jgi:hypothetical protein
MYGVPDDLPLERFVGHSLNQISLGQFQIQLHFDGAGSMTAESRWELRGPAGDLVDASCPFGERDCFRIHQVIGAQVSGYSITAPRFFTLHFETGHALTIFDDSKEYESFSIKLADEGGIFV